MYPISHSPSIFAHIQVGGVGWQRGGGGKAAKYGESPFTAKMLPFIHDCQPHRPSEHFLNLDSKKNDFEILAEV